MFIPHTLFSSLYSAQFILLTLFRSLHSVHFIPLTLYSTYFIPLTLFSSLYSAHFILLTLFRLLYSAHFIPLTLFRSLLYSANFIPLTLFRLLYFLLLPIQLHTLISVFSLPVAHFYPSTSAHLLPRTLILPTCFRSDVAARISLFPCPNLK